VVSALFPPRTLGRATGTKSSSAEEKALPPVLQKHTGHCARVTSACSLVSSHQLPVPKNIPVKRQSFIGLNIHNIHEKSHGKSNHRSANKLTAGHLNNSTFRGKRINFYCLVNP